jgi:hypothetical protein
MASFGRSRTMPQFSDPSSPSDIDSPIRPRRPSLDPQGEILSTRGQYLPSLIRRRSFSTQKSDGFLDTERDETGSFRDRFERPALARAKDLIGEGKPSYNWYLFLNCWHHGNLISDGAETNRADDHCPRQQYYHHPNALKGLPTAVYALLSVHN